MKKETVKIHKKGKKHVECKNIIESFVNKLLSNSKDIPSNIVHLVSDNFWDLIYYDA